LGTSRIDTNCWCLHGMAWWFSLTRTVCRNTFVLTAARGLPWPPARLVVGKFVCHSKTWSVTWQWRIFPWNVVQYSVSRFTHLGIETSLVKCINSICKLSVWNEKEEQSVLKTVKLCPATWSITCAASTARRLMAVNRNRDSARGFNVTLPDSTSHRLCTKAIVCLRHTIAFLSFTAHGEQACMTQAANRSKSALRELNTSPRPGGRARCSASALPHKWVSKRWVLRASTTWLLVND